MRRTGSTLLPVFRSELQGRLLAMLFARPDQEGSLSALAARLEAHVATVQREVERMEEAGVLTSRRVGNTRLVRVNPDSPYAEELGALVLKVYGPVHVLARLLAGVEGVQAVYVFGSWAQRYRGVSGRPPGDLDVLLIGRPDRDVIYGVELQAQAELGLEVQITVRSRESWEEGQDALIRNVREGALVPVPIAEA